MLLPFTLTQQWTGSNLSIRVERSITAGHHSPLGCNAMVHRLVGLTTGSQMLVVAAMMVIH